MPRALLKSDEHQYGVYSFEAGQAKTAAELTLEDVRRIAELHQGAPGADDAASRQGAAGTDNGDESLALKRSQWRINSGDFGPQNLLLTDAGQVTAVDWEAVGWDDPARLAVGFVAHAASEALTDEARRAFLEVYADRRRLSKNGAKSVRECWSAARPRMGGHLRVGDDAEVVAGKQFAHAEFDRHTYLTHVMDLVRRRLQRATQSHGYRF